MKHILSIVSFLALGLCLIMLMLPSAVRTLIVNAEEITIYADHQMDSVEITQISALVTSDLDTMVKQRDQIAYEAAHTVAATSIARPSTGDLLGAITIDSAAIKNNLYFGDTNAILTQGAGMYAGSALPGFSGLKLIAAHNQRGQFGELEKVVVGDIVTVTMPYGTYGYQVKESKVVNCNDKTAYDFSVTKDQLIVYTCYPMYYTSSTDLRLFLYCERVSGPLVK